VGTNHSGLLFDPEGVVTYFLNNNDQGTLRVSKVGGRGCMRFFRFVCSSAPVNSCGGVIDGQVALSGSSPAPASRVPLPGWALHAGAVPYQRLTSVVP
jgi:hypothetical protein